MYYKSINKERLNDDMNQSTATKAEPYTVEIDCPAHGDHKATLFQHGHKYAGIWECPVTGESDSCEHESHHVEETAVDTFNPVSGHGQYEVQVYVCDACECTVEGDPAADAAEDRADMAYDEMRDNQL